MNSFFEDNLVERIKFRGKYRIESTRLKDYDYSSEGAYFITICTKDREYFFGEIVDGKIQETEQLKICMACWLDLPNHYVNCILDAFVIMPNHVHGIIFIKNDNYVAGGKLIVASVIASVVVETGFKPVSTDTTTDTTTGTTTDAQKTKLYSVSEIVRGFKTFTARKINDFQNTPGKTFWQSRFHDHIIRNEGELNRIRKYIFNNPFNWKDDRNNKG